jgi:hypothetical protein
MAVEHLTATSRGDNPTTSPVTTNYGLNCFESTVAVSAASSDGSTYKMALVPSNARISGLSRIIGDDLASSGSPVLLIGTTGGGTTADPDAFHTGVSASAAIDARIFEDPADIGKYLWEIAGETSDPNTNIWIQLEVETAATNTGGDVTLSLVYWIDGS